MKQIVHCVDSVEHELDSVGKQYYKSLQGTYYKRPRLLPQDSIHITRMAQKKGKHTLDFDKMVEEMPSTEMLSARQMARSSIKSMRSDLEWKTMVTGDGDNYIRRHWVEWHQKMTFSLACILFFFVGAPLGAIIRKGGLGMPTVISVIIFIIWYMISTSSMKMAREGSINMVVGMWISTIVIAPFSVFITYKANLDSVVFNLEAYKDLFCRLLGIRTKRHLMRKEVIINEPRMDVVPVAVDDLRAECLAYSEQKQLRRAPNYRKTFFHYEPDAEVEAINEKMETLIEELSNSRNTKILGVLNEFPILYVTAHTSPFHSAKYNMAAGVFFPLGFILWFRIWRFRLRLHRDLRIIVRTCNRLDQVINGTEDASETSGVEADALAVQQHSKRKWRVLKWVVLVIVVALSVHVSWNVYQRYRHKKALQRTEQQRKKAEQADQPIGPRTLQLPAAAPDFSK